MSLQLDALKLFEHLPDRVTVTDRDGNILYVNPSFEAVTGYSAQEAVGKKPSILKSGHHPPSFYRELWETILAGRPFRAEVINRKKSGELYYEDQLIVPVLGEGQQPVWFVSFARDITERKALDARVRFLINHDPLTGTLNRRGLLSRARRSLEEARETGKPVSALFIDLDNFRTINEGYGHRVGDLVLIAASQRIREHIRPSDTCGRWGGDEFLALLPGLDAEAAEAVARGVQARLEEPAELDETAPTIYLQASVGVATFPCDGQSIEEVVAVAEQAMCAAKERVRGVGRIDRRSSKAERMRLLLELPRALQNGQIDLDYQPIIDLKSRRVTGYEALIRWRHPELGTILPGDFIALAEETRDIVAVDKWALRRAAQDALALVKGGLAHDIAVNISPRTLTEGSIIEVVKELATSAPQALAHLVVEVTESALVRMDAARQSLESLRQLGVRVALDDFGTGYSSMAYLEEIPADIIKIDRRFVSGIGVRKGSEAIIRAIIALCDEFGCRVLAEGIEGSHQLDWLAASGCHEGQGYLIGPPASRDELGWTGGSTKAGQEGPDRRVPARDLVGEQKGAGAHGARALTEHAPLTLRRPGDQALL